jgi:signal transduction histidine kinase
VWGPQLAVGRHLPHRTVRIRLTLLYGGLFLLSGAALVAITYVLFQQATEYTKPHLPNIPHTPAIQQHQLPQLPRFLPQLAQDQHQLAQDQHQLAEVLPLGQARPGLAYSVPLLAGDQHQLARDQHQLARAVNQLARAVHQVAQAGSVQAAQRAADSHQLLVNSGIALAIMAVLALLAGWLVAGRVLQPLEDSYRAQRQFVANASHELRAPLTRQRALIEVALASSDANFASLRKAHERVLASEQHLEQLIDALLALTRSQAGLERRERSDLAVLATRALQAQRPDVERLRLDVDTTRDPAPTTGDPRLLERLITRSRATCATGRPDSSATRTARSINSCGYLDRLASESRSAADVGAV